MGETGDPDLLSSAAGQQLGPAAAPGQVAAPASVRAEDVVSELQAELVVLRRTVRTACSDRDTARLSLRRVAASADHAWRSRLATLERQASEDARLRAVEAEARLRAVEEARQAAIGEAQHWRDLYAKSSERLSTILRRSGLIWAGRLFPRRLRVAVRGWLFGA